MTPDRDVTGTPQFTTSAGAQFQAIEQDAAGHMTNALNVPSAGWNVTASTRARVLRTVPRSDAPARPDSCVPDSRPAVTVFQTYFRLPGTPNRLRHFIELLIPNQSV